MKYRSEPRPAALLEAEQEEDLDALPPHILAARRRAWDARARKYAPMVRRSWPSGMLPRQFAAQWRAWSAKTRYQLIDEALRVLFSERPELRKHGNGQEVTSILWREPRRFFLKGYPIPYYRNDSPTSSAKFRREVARGIARYKTRPAPLKRSSWASPVQTHS
jgi:hypothetical protein